MPNNQCSTLVEMIKQIMPCLLASRALQVPLRQRAKFEGWFKIELTAALELQEARVCIEQDYPTGLGNRYRADLKVKLGAIGKEFFIMLKTVNTNFRFDGVKNCTRPITKNIQGVIADIDKLRFLPHDTVGYVLFPVFPVSASERARQDQLKRHIDRLKDFGNIVTDSFVRRASDWGISWFLMEVKFQGQQPRRPAN